MKSCLVHCIYATDVLYTVLLHMIVDNALQCKINFTWLAKRARMIMILG